MKEFKFKYKSRFELPRAEADFVCALARILNDSDPDLVLRAIIRIFARECDELRREVWRMAGEDGRGPWPP